MYTSTCAYSCTYMLARMYMYRARACNRSISPLRRPYRSIAILNNGYWLSAIARGSVYRLLAIVPCCHFSLSAIVYWDKGDGRDYRLSDLSIDRPNFDDIGYRLSKIDRLLNIPSAADRLCRIRGLLAVGLLGRGQVRRRGVHTRGSAGPVCTDRSSALRTGCTACHGRRPRARRGAHVGRTCAPRARVRAALGAT